MSAGIWGVVLYRSLLGFLGCAVKCGLFGCKMRGFKIRCVVVQVFSKDVLWFYRGFLGSFEEGGFLVGNC